MLRNAAIRLLAIGVLTGLPFQYGFTQDRVKVEEGRYVLLKDKNEVPNTGHSWTLWRLPGGGFELEDHIELPPSALALVLPPNTPERILRLQHDYVRPSEVHATYGPDWQLLELTASGARANHAQRDVLKCRSDAKGLECHGDDNSAKLKLDTPRGFFWWYRIPMLLRPWLPSPTGATTAPAPAKVFMLSFPPGPGVERTSYNSAWGDVPDLEPAELTIASLGQAMLVIGDSTLLTEKYRLDFHPKKGERLSLIVWTDTKTILAVEDPGLPGNLMVLASHKNYPDDAPPAPAQSKP